MVVKDGHPFAEQEVISFQRRHDAASHQKEVAFARALHSGNPPLVARGDGPFDGLGDDLALVAHRADGNPAHIDGGLWRWLGFSFAGHGLNSEVYNDEHSVDYHAGDDALGDSSYGGE